MGTIAKVKRNRVITPKVSKGEARIVCEKCGAVAVSYYVQPMWTYPDDFDGRLPIFGYCAKHPQDVMNMIPKNLRSAIRLVSEMSGRAGIYPRLRSELILHKKGDQAIGEIAEKLKADRNFPHVEDTQILNMAEKPAGSVYLIYDAKGRFEKKFGKYDDATEYCDPATQVIIYCGSNNFSGMGLLKLLKKK